MENFEEMMEQREKIAKTNIVYLNDKDEIVDKEEAVKVIIAEYDKDGNLINEVFGTCEKNENDKFEVEDK